MIFTVDWGSEKRTAKGIGRSNGVPRRNAHEEYARNDLLPALIRDAFDITPPYVLTLSPNRNVAIRSPAARRPSRPAHRVVNTDSGSIPAAEQVEEKAIAGSAAIARPPASSQFKKRRRDTKLGTCVVSRYAKSGLSGSPIADGELTSALPNGRHLVSHSCVPPIPADCLQNKPQRPQSFKKSK
ncbi:MULTISPECIES: hypothetical protein [Burkholderia cepacia complex]|uniref:hypothetical protein n=1 Tax=Burkholderia cepacia complex TaxID=87882 RepID=UPI0012BA589A|nr:MULTISPECIES: hypothetical protein [Burkholderia cepacia complex]